MKPQILFVASWLWAATATSADLPANLQDRPIEEVSIVGNRVLTDRAILAKLATRPPERALWVLWHKTPRNLDPLALDLDEKRIVAMYRQRGYFSARILETRVTPGSRGRVRVQIRVEEGEPTRIASIKIRAAADKPREPSTIERVSGAKRTDERVAVSLRTGDVFLHDAYLKAKAQLLLDLVQHGYAHARVDGRVVVDRAERRADVALVVDRGPLVRFGRTLVIGERTVPERSIRARVAWNRGDIFDLAKLDLTQGRLYGLGAFQSVRLDYEQAERPLAADVTIRVSEAAVHDLVLGGGLGIDRSRVEVRARGRYQVRNFLWPLATLGLEARPGYTVIPGRANEAGLTGESRVSLDKQDFLRPRWRLQTEGAYTRDVFEAYRTNGPRARLALSRELFANRLLVSASAQLTSESIQVDDPALETALGVVRPYRLGLLSQSVVVDFRYGLKNGLANGLRDSPGDRLRDRALHRGHGVYMLALLEEGTLLGHGSYLKVAPELRGYLRFVPRIAGAARARLGWIDAENAPITQRFYGGGAGGHRGFAYRRLSPMIEDQDGRLVPIGGSALLESTVEVRFDLIRLGGRWLGTALFLDGGDVAKSLSDIPLSQLHWACGAGLRYETPVGSLRLDLGVRLTRVDSPPDPGERFAVHLALGEAF